MVTGVAFLICALTGLLIVVRPALALLVYAISASYAEGLGPSAWLSDAGFFEFTMETMLLLLLARAIFSLLGATHSSRTVKRVAWVGVFVIAWVLLGEVIKEVPLVSSLAHIPYLCLPFVTVWLAFVDRKNSLNLVYAFVSFQVLFALVVLTVPSLQVLQGNRYITYLGPEVPVETPPVRLALPDASTLKWAAGNHYAQFNNPNVLGLYGAVGTCAGVGMALGRKGWVRLVGMLVLAAGVFTWLNSLTRGPVLGAIVMAGVFLVLTKRSRANERAVVAILIILASFTAGLTAWVVSPGLAEYLLPAGDNVSVVGRLAGYQEALRLIPLYPLFGFDASYTWLPELYPHFIGLLFAAQYGLIVGIVATVLTFGFCPIYAVRAVRNPDISASDSFVAATLYGSLAGIAATNNFAAPILCALIIAHLVLVGDRSGPSSSKSRDVKAPSGGVKHAGIRHKN